MKAVIEGGKILIPEEIREKIKISDKGECEIEVKNGEIHIIPLLPKPMNMIEILENSNIVVPIDDMMKSEEVDVD